MSSPQIILDTDYALVQYYPDTKIVHHVLRKPIAGETFRSVLMAGLDTLKKHGATKWLSDDHVNGPFTAEDGVWAATVWQPQVIAAGWKFWAIVVPDSIEARFDVKDVIADTPAIGVRVMVFTKTEEALEWLEKR